MTEYTAQQFTITPDPGNPGDELSLRKLDLNLSPVAQIAFGNDSNTYLSFRSVVGGLMTEHMQIDANGNVGIGTVSSGEKLEVNGTVKATAFDGNLNGSQIATGTIDDARLPLSISRTADVDARFDPLNGHDHDGVDSKKIPALSTTYFDSLNAVNLTDLNGSQITTGTVAADRIDAAIVRTSALAVPNGIATLDSNTLVVQNPANSTATPTASKIPIADASGKLTAGWGGNASTLATLDANTRVVEAANTVWDGTAARSASPTPAANTIPVGNASGNLASGWGGSASTLATLDASCLVIQNPANATATPTASKIPIADASGKLASGWGGNASTLATLDANTRLVQAANTVWDGTASRSASPAPTANTIPVLDANAKFPGSITGDADTIDTFHASSTPAGNTIAVGNASGKLASGWGGSASTLATLDASSLVVQNPANATVTPTASKIPIADASGKLAAGWGGSASTLATLDANIRLVQVANTLWDGTAGRSASPTPAANTIPVLNASAKFPGSITGDADTVDTFHASQTPAANTIAVGNASGKLASGWGGSAATLATLDASSLVVQNPANATATPAASKIPIADASGKLAAGWGGSASTLATLDANARVVQAANTVWDGTAGRSASPTPAANTVPVSGSDSKIAFTATNADRLENGHWVVKASGSQLGNGGTLTIGLGSYGGYHRYHATVYTSGTVLTRVSEGYNPAGGSYFLISHGYNPGAQQDQLIIGNSSSTVTYNYVVYAWE